MTCAACHGVDNDDDDDEAVALWEETLRRRSGLLIIRVEVVGSRFFFLSIAKTNEAMLGELEIS